jgi:SAM-dependent methyltransferase
VDETLYDEYAAMDRSHWWFVGRRRILQRWMANVLRELPGRAPHRRILDVGCGVGGNFDLLAPYGFLIGVDRRPRRGPSTPKPPTPLCKADLLHPPFKNGVFDLVAAFEVIEHFQDDAVMAQRLSALLKPGGILLASVPAYRWLWGPHDDLAHHCHRYGRLQLRDTLARAGFEDVEVYGMNWILLPLMWLHRKIQSWKHQGAPKSAVPSDFALTRGPLINPVLRWIFSWERHSILWRMPIGATWLASARKGG